MTEYKPALTASDTKKAKIFYDILCWGGLLIVLLPVGIANIVLGYGMGDSPCTLCWGQREEMAFIGVVALFMVRYGFKPKYLATMMVMAAVGLWMSFRHVSNHAARDIGQGFGLEVFGLHTQMWAEIVFWCVVMLFGLAVYFAPRFDALVAEARASGKGWRPMTRFMTIAFGIVAVIIGSNAFQALWSTGVPPYWGNGDPVRFSMNPKYVTWTDASWKGFFGTISPKGKRAVANPDMAFAPNAKALGMVWDHDAAKGPLPVDGALSIAAEHPIKGIDKKLDTLAMIDGTLMVASKYDFWRLNNDYQADAFGQMDPWFSLNVLDITAITPYKDNAFMLVGMNKCVLTARFNPKADDVKGWANFTDGRDQVEAVEGFGRHRWSTERSARSFIHAAASDGKYVYMATVPDQFNHKKLIISKALLKDWMLSGEFEPVADLKDGRSLGELYVTGMTWDDGLLYLVSKNYNVLFTVDPATESVKDVWSLPETLTDIRGLAKVDDKILVLDHNKVVELMLP